MECELILKEEEKHRLGYIGVITNLQDTIGKSFRMFQTFKVSPVSNRNFCLDLFYEKVLHYGEFIAKEKWNNTKLKLHLQNITKAILKDWQDIQPALLDKELKTPSNLSIAYHLSPTVYGYIYTDFCQEEKLFPNPPKVNDFFKDKAKCLYPLSLKQYVAWLKKEDDSFWNITCIYIKHIVKIVANCVLARADNVNNKDLVEDHSWTDTYEILKKKLTAKGDDIPIFTSGTDFRNYVIRIGKYRILNLDKKYSLNEVHPEDFNSVYEAETVETATEEPSSYIKELDIDVTNPYEIAYAVSIILLNKHHPLHTLLVKGIEEKVDILITKVISGLTYKEIVEEMYGTGLSEKDFQAAVVKARKDYERVRKELVKRFTSLIEKKDSFVCHTSSPE